MKKSSVPAWVTFIGLLLLLLGLYASGRTGVNFLLFPKYPTAGVLSLNFSGIAAYGPNEADCLRSQTYSDPAEPARPISNEEKFRQNQDQETCLSSVREARRASKVNDIAQSVLFLFLGLGTLFSRRYFF